MSIFSNMLSKVMMFFGLDILSTFRKQLVRTGLNPALLEGGDPIPYTRQILLDYERYFDLNGSELRKLAWYLLVHASNGSITVESMAKECNTVPENIRYYLGIFKSRGFIKSVGKTGIVEFAFPLAFAAACCDLYTLKRSKDFLDVFNQYDIVAYYVTYNKKKLKDKAYEVPNWNEIMKSDAYKKFSVAASYMRLMLINDPV